MTSNKTTIAQVRKYAVINVESAKKICLSWLKEAELDQVINLGLPEIDDRYHVWRVPLLNTLNQERVGELVIDAKTSLIANDKSTSKMIIESRLLGRKIKASEKKINRLRYNLSNLRNTIALGDSEDILKELPSESIDLVFTSPPYFNARPEYNDYVTYDDYLRKIQNIIHCIHRVLAEGRFFVINISPVLVRRSNRNESSQRIAVPFDLHRIFMQENFDFIDDIIWVKPEGAGWATNRGRRFAADRNPLQYKPVPITEYVLVYRKHTTKLIDWNIRYHPQKDLVVASKIDDNYERTNVWYIKPTFDKRHPAIFPVELAEKVITYYSFKNDVVLDPFAGIGTVGRAAIKMNRRFVLIDQNANYIDIIRDEAKNWLGSDADSVFTFNCPPIDASDRLL